MMDLQENFKETILLWKIVGETRANVDQFIEWLINDTDYFRAPCSTEYHLAVSGGLAQHSLNVYNLLKEKVDRFSIPVALDTCIICGLGHDLCKTNSYIRGTKNVKENGQWKEKQVWKVKDQFPLGHGEKSLSLLQNFMPVTKDEALAIRWHMVAFDPGIHFGYPSGFAFREAAKNPLVTLLFTADYEASQIVEVGL